MSSRDIRYGGGGLYTMFSFRLMHASSKLISRNLRPFISRYGRVVEEGNSNTLIISDTGKNIHRLYSLVKKIDTELFPKRVEYLKSINEKGTQIVEEKTSLLNFLKDQHILFIIAFSLISGILGFGVRGYMMKKVENGW